MPDSLLLLLFTITSMVLASPLDIGRRQLVVTLTVTTTSTAAASSSQPIIPIIPTAIPPYTTTGSPSGIVTASPVSNAAVFTPITHLPVPIIAQSLPGTIFEPIIPSSAPTSTGLPLEDPCQVVCKADVCLLRRTSNPACSQTLEEVMD